MTKTSAIATDLANRATPLIRYDIGDLATTKNGACACGRGLPRIGHVTGRTSDILYTPEGKRISGISILDTMIIHIPGFKQVQIVQERLDELVFNIVKDEYYSDESLNTLRHSVAKYFGPSMKHRDTLGLRCRCSARLFKDSQDIDRFGHRPGRRVVRPGGVVAPVFEDPAGRWTGSDCHHCTGRYLVCAGSVARRRPLAGH